MAKIFIGIALVVTLATAVLGFMAKSNIDRVQGEKKEARTAQNKAEGALHVKEGELKKAQDDVAAAKTALDEKDKEVTAKATQVDDLTKKVAQAAAELETTKADLAKAKETPTTPAGEKIVDLTPQLKAMTERAEAAETGLAEAKQIQETLNRKVKDTEAKIAPLEQYRVARERYYQRPGISGRVLAVNSGWNFVVLSIGDKQGLINNSPLLVMRGGEPIAKIRVTSIEPSTSIADVIPGSVRKGVTVQPGDNVVVEGIRNQPFKAPASPTGAPAEQPVTAPVNPALPN